VECGDTTTVRLCTTSPADFGPFTFTLDGQTETSANQCHTFTVGPITEDTQVCGTVTDNTGCVSAEACVDLTVTEITPEIAVSGDTDCNGNLTLTASAPGFEGCTFVWSEGGTELGTGATLAYRQLDGVCHTIAVAATCGGCVGSADVNILQCVETTVGCGTDPTPAAQAARAESRAESSARKAQKGGQKGGQKGQKGGKKGGKKGGQKGAAKKRN
jgi:hypothetical protein